MLLKMFPKRLISVSQPIRRLIILCLLAGMGSAQAETFLWQISKGEQRLYLGGTLHLLSKKDFPLPVAYQKAYGVADVLVLETDLNQLSGEAFQQRLLALTLYPKGQDIQQQLRPATYQALKEYCQANQLSLAQLNAFKPGMVALTLTNFEFSKLGVTEAGVDQFFHNQAMADAKPRLSLETLEEQLQLIANMGSANPDAFIRWTLRDMQTIEENMQLMVRAWRNGNRQRMNQKVLVPMAKEAPRLYQRLFVERNQRWLPQLNAMLKTPEVELVLVGAGHLVGKEGLLTLLQQQGYQIKQL